MEEPARPPAKRLLIVYHSQTGNTRALAEAAHAGATDAMIEAVQTWLLIAQRAGPGDLLWAQGLLLGTPENFGYMSGGMKDFLDRTFYPVEGKLQPLPYAVFVSAGNDGAGAVQAMPAKGGIGRPDRCATIRSPSGRGEERWLTSTSATTGRRTKSTRCSSGR